MPRRIWDPISPSNIYLFKVNNRNIRIRYEIYSKLTIKTQEQRHESHSAVFIVNFKDISHIFRVFLLLTLNKQIFSGKHLSMMKPFNYFRNKIPLDV